MSSDTTGFEPAVLPMGNMAINCPARTRDGVNVGMTVGVSEGETTNQLTERQSDRNKPGIQGTKAGQVNGNAILAQSDVGDIEQGPGMPTGDEHESGGSGDIAAIMSRLALPIVLLYGIMFRLALSVGLIARMSHLALSAAVLPFARMFRLALSAAVLPFARMFRLALSAAVLLFARMFRLALPVVLLFDLALREICCGRFLVCGGAYLGYRLRNGPAGICFGGLVGLAISLALTKGYNFVVGKIAPDRPELKDSRTTREYLQDIFMLALGAAFSPAMCSPGMG